VLKGTIIYEKFEGSEAVKISEVSTKVGIWAGKKVYI
jgi:hypothetical protein